MRAASASSDDRSCTIDDAVAAWMREARSKAVNVVETPNSTALSSSVCDAEEMLDSADLAASLLLRMVSSAMIRASHDELMDARILA